MGIYFPGTPTTRATRKERFLKGETVEPGYRVYSEPVGRERKETSRLVRFARKRP